MTQPDPKEIIHVAEKFVHDNLKECCQELVRYRNSSLLEDGRVRELSNILRPVANSYAQTVAEKLVTSAAVEFISKQS